MEEREAQGERENGDEERDVGERNEVEFKSLFQKDNMLLTFLLKCRWKNKILRWV